MPLGQRKDLLGSKEHELLFRNITNIRTVMEKIFLLGDHRDSLEIIIQSYMSNMKEFIYEYEKYFAMLKTVECQQIIVDKTHHPEFLKFIANPPPQGTQPFFHNFVQTPLEFYTDGLQKNFQFILAQLRIDSQEYRDLNHLIEKLKVHIRKNELKSNCLIIADYVCPCDDEGC